MKLSIKAFDRDYWSADLDRVKGNPRPFKIRRQLKRELSRARRRDARADIEARLAEGRQ